jgi:hypothetical protein
MFRNVRRLAVAAGVLVPLLAAGSAHALITDSLTSTGKNWDYQPYDVQVHSSALSTTSSSQNLFDYYNDDNWGNTRFGGGYNITGSIRGSAFPGRNATGGIYGSLNSWGVIFNNYFSAAQAQGTLNITGGAQHVYSIGVWVFGLKVKDESGYVDTLNKTWFSWMGGITPAYEQQFTIGPVPCIVKIKGAGSVKVASSLSAPAGQNFNGKLTPEAGLWLNISAGVGTTVGSAGLSGYVSILKATIPLAANIVATGNTCSGSSSVNGRGDLTVSSLDGVLDLYASLGWFFNDTYRLASWSGPSRTYNLFNSSLNTGWGASYCP